ncbi:MAG: hypothetical protein MJY83_01125, partial [Bacteroidales bacterium]|nr:hypothetical protein [Bacteroidales bacterium]
QRKAKIDAVKAVYDAEGAAEDAKSEIARLTGLALAALERLDVPSERIQMLHRFADSLIGRAK